MQRRYAPGVNRGDPGILSFLGKAASSLVGGAIGLATGQGVGGFVTPFVSQPKTQGIPMAMPGGLPLAPQLASGPPAIQKTPGVVGTLQRLVPGGATGYEAVACPKGYHANRASYFLKDGTFIAAGSKCVKNRSRNPLNPRALRRAVGRVDAGKVWQGKLHEIETAKYSKAGNKKT
jgi:hypothetical protein